MSERTVDFVALANPGIRGLRAYDPGHDLVALRRAHPAVLVELGSNENPYGASPRAKQAAAAALERLHVYPDPLGGDLKRALAACTRFVVMLEGAIVLEGRPGEVSQEAITAAYFGASMERAGVAHG